MSAAGTPQALTALRSWLFVPGDSHRKQAEALASDADVVILDLEDSVAASEQAQARERVAHVLRDRSPGKGPQLWVRVNSPASGQLQVDLGEIAAAGALPDGVVLPKVSAADEIIDVSRYLATLEKVSGRIDRDHAAAGHRDRDTRRGSRAAAVSGGTRRLRGDARAPVRPDAGAEDLSAALGASARDAGGRLTFTFQLARTMCLLAAAALGLPALDTVFTNFRDGAALAEELEHARRDGFSGKLAIHPDQIAAINAAFTPSAAEREHAQRVVAAFAAAPGSGVASLDGQMIDRPHLLQAERILAVARRAGDPT